MTPNEKLAAALAELHKVQKGGRRVFRSRDISRLARSRLVRAGFLRQVMKGWLVVSAPGLDPGDTTPWFASFWEFCARYCTDRFGARWCLSPEHSLRLHAEDTVVPAQVIVNTPSGSNNTIRLLFGTSLYDLRQAHMPAATDLSLRGGLRLYEPHAALIRVPETFFARHRLETQVVLSRLRDPSALLRRLLDGGHTAAAGRLAGALRAIGQARMAEEILGAMKAAGYDVRELNPFAPGPAFGPLEASAAPVVTRLQALWKSSREQVLEDFPKAPGRPKDRKAYLQQIDEIYRADAYHSLSIEGYDVTPDLIERVRAGNWDPQRKTGDRDSRDALAARGYWQAFRLVKDAVAGIIRGANPGAVARDAHREWYRELFQPSVGAGLMAPATLAGYRESAVFIRASRHVPPRAEAVLDAMPALFDLLENEPEPAVRAVLGHWLFGYVHPYPDGNGRMARFLMNTMLASGGYPWIVIRVEDRDECLQALEAASVGLDIKPFTMFLAQRLQGSPKRN